MDLLKTVSYIFSGSVCLCLAVILIAMKSDFSFQNKSYQRIKNFLAYSALIDVAVDVIVLSLIAHQRNIFILDSFLIPVAYYAQLYLMSRAVLGLAHSSESLHTHFRIHILPITAIITLYVGGYLFHDNSYTLFSEIGYITYTTTIWAKLLSTLLYLLIVAEFITFLVQLIRETRLYLYKFNNYYSGTEVINGRKLSTITWCFLGYFILAGCDFLFSSVLFDSFFMIINTCIFIVFVVVITNLQGTYQSVKQVANYNIQRIENEKNENFLNKNTQEKQIIVAEKDLSENITSIIQQWESSDDKPYLKEGIVLAEVAKQLGVTEVKLSFTLNHSMKLNFNSWINKLRIEESKRIIENNPCITISEIAFASGFTDLNTFTRNFKKVTTKTPISYKKSCTLSSPPKNSK